MKRKEISENALKEVFGSEAQQYLRGADIVIERAKTHKYSFCSDEAFKALAESSPPRVAEMNFIIAHEVLEKSHLCAVNSMLRNRSWIEAATREYEYRNLFGFAASARGFIESVADGMDGLNGIAVGLARHQSGIRRYLTGKIGTEQAIFSSFEERLDHYMFAGWSREKDKVRKAKDTQAYVEAIQSPLTPDLLKHWRKLCSLAHPSSVSVEVFYEFDDHMRDVHFIADAESKCCERLLAEIAPTLNGILPYAMNPSLLILRVMHKFEGYPRIPEMKRMDFRQLPAWKEISALI